MKNFIFFLVSLLSLPALGCINMKASLDLNGEILLIDQKVNNDQTYSFMQGPYVVNVVLASGQKEGLHFVDIKVDMKTAQTLQRVSNGKILVKNNQEAMMTSTDNETQKTFIYKMTVKNI